MIGNSTLNFANANDRLRAVGYRVFGKLRPRKRRPKTSKTKTSKTKTSKAKTLKPEFLRIFAISTLYRKLYLLFNVSMLCSSFHHAGKNLIEIASDGSSF